MAGTLSQLFSCRAVQARRDAASAVTFTGSGWHARAAIDLLIGPPRSEAHHLAWARTTASGRFRRTVRMSSTADPGRYVVLACRRSCREKVSAPLRIVGGARTAVALSGPLW